MKRHIFYIILLICIPQVLFATKTITLSDRYDKYPVGTYLEYLVDKSGELTILDVCSPGYALKFKQGSGDIPDLGIGNATYWIRLKILDKSNFYKKWLLMLELLFISNMEFYKVTNAIEDNRVIRVEYESLIANKLKHRILVLSLDTNKNQQEYYYLKLRVYGKVILPINILLYSSFNHYVQKEYIFLGIYYGIVTVMILYNLLLFFIFRDRNYLFYTFYIISFATWQFAFNGLGFEFFWPKNLYFHIISPFLFSPVVLFNILLFSANFLEIKKRDPYIYKFMFALKIICALEFIILLSGYINPTLIIFANILNAVVTITVFTVGIKNCIKGFRPAIYFVVAWSAFSFGMIYFNLFMLGFLQFSFFAYYIVQIGSAIEVILFSVALTDRINVLRKEKEAAQAKTIEIQKEANINLEKKVIERTKDLNKAKKFIENIIEKSPVAIHVIDKQGCITLENTAMRKILNSKGETSIGMNIYNFSYHPDSKLAALYKDALEGIPYHGSNYLFKNPVTSDKFYFNIIIAPIFESNSSAVENVLTMYYDNTEKALAEKELQRALRRISEDLMLAEQIQENFISSDYKKIKDIGVDVYFQPMIEVGGDIYDIYKINESQYRVFIADATGHGIQAALTTMIIKTEYDRIKLFELTPDSILEILNNIYIRRYSKLKSYFTCAVLDIDVKENKMYFASAGHLEQIFIYNNQIQYIISDGPLIGIIEKSIFNLKTINYNRGDKVFMFTDGIVEVLSESYEVYGPNRLLECFKKNINNSISVTIKNIITEIEEFQGKISATDDRTLIGIQL